MNTDDKEINVPLVKALLEEQFPQWAHLSITPVSEMGWDNRTFRLGDQMTVRLPSDDAYDPQAQKENRWLPFLSANLSIEVPKVLGVGKPSDFFPRHWSIRQWIEGKSLNRTETFDQSSLILPLVQFLKELHSLDGTGGPVPVQNDGFRGGHPSAYADQVQGMFLKLEGTIDIPAAKKIWNEALTSKYEKSPVWVHGDMSSGNLLIKDNQLSAVIDFGSMAVGDPSCDLILAWTYFNTDARKTFKQTMNRDPQMWARARGWALLKVLFPLTSEYKTSRQMTQAKEIFGRIPED